ncbi:hypothetical protein AB0L82_22090 [Nocardia sp. NPDC052001]|uniref:hypothetical protein n=1 Tax=Nocardia sp. NPDC052001 TaxID=3154853 RepID=UPI00343E624F
MSNPVQIRLSGNLGDIAHVLAALVGSTELRVEVDTHIYRDTDREGCVYAELTSRDSVVLPDKHRRTLPRHLPTRKDVA